MNLNDVKHQLLKDPKENLRNIRSTSPHKLELKGRPPKLIDYMLSTHTTWYMLHIICTTYTWYSTHYIVLYASHAMFFKIMTIVSGTLLN